MEQHSLTDDLLDLQEGQDGQAPEPEYRPEPDQGPAPEEPAESFYVGRYRSREEAEAAYAEKDRYISQLQNETHRANQIAQERQRLLDTFMQQPRTDLGQLPTTPAPDPDEDPDGHRQWLSTLEDRAAQRALGQFQMQWEQRQSDTQKIDAAWAYIQRAYPDVAQYPDLVGNTWKAMTGGRIPRDPLPAIESLVGQVRTLLAQVQPQQQQPQQYYQQPEPQQYQQQPRIVGAPVAGRTQGVVSGRASSGQRQNGATQRPRTLSEEIAELQAPTGLF